ncbi:MAG: hypothetical protein EPN93_17440 [Spirochaetes bacterium]|nr:MAG: hypothetical protein EPN93_17440 [Spirochaetota bacterium]
MGFENSFDGIKDNATWKLAAGIARGTDEGKVVKFSAAKTVAKCAAEDKILGVLETIDHDNAYGVVGQRGYKTVSYSGTAPTAGLETELVANASGGVKTPATPGTGIKYLVVEVDTTATTLVLFLG